MSLSRVLAGNALEGGQVATTILVIGEGAALFAAFCPSWFTVRSPFFHEQTAREGNVNSIRAGEAAGAVSTLLVGAAAAAMTHTAMPLLGAIAVSAVMIGGYEYSIAHPAQSPDKRDAVRHPVAGALQWRQT